VSNGEDPPAGIADNVRKESSWPPLVYLMDKRGRFVNAFDLAKPPKQAADELEKYL
jgi:hypothetical protein